MAAAPRRLKKSRYAEGPPKAAVEAGEARASLKQIQRLPEPEAEAEAAPRADEEAEAEAEAEEEEGEVSTWAM